MRDLLWAEVRKREAECKKIQAEIDALSAAPRPGSPAEVDARVQAFMDAWARFAIAADAFQRAVIALQNARGCDDT